MDPKIITNFSANLNRTRNGQLDSGQARYDTTFGLNTFADPSSLSFMEVARDITGGIITDCVMATKIFSASGETFVIGIGHLGRFYKIKVNDIATKNPDFDTPTLQNIILIYTLAAITGFNATNAITSSSGGVGVVDSIDTTNNTITITITSGTFNATDSITDTTTSNTTTISTVAPPTFLHGGYMERYNTQVFIGHDAGVIRTDINGLHPVMVGASSSWTSDIPHPLKAFVGSLYVGNGINIAEIDSSNIVTTYTKLSPGIASFFRIVDLDVSADGVYLVITSPRLPQNVIDTDPNTDEAASNDSMLSYWNGTDQTVTRFITLPSFNASGYLTYSSFEFVFGNDALGASMGPPGQKSLTLSSAETPLPNAMSANGNMIMWMSPEQFSGKLAAALHISGQFDQDTPPGHYRPLVLFSTLSAGDVLKVPCMTPCTNILYGGVSSGYTNNLIGTSKVYFSTLEYNGTTTKYGFYAFNLFPTGTGNSLGGVFETQEELFGKKVSGKEVRVYLEPAVSGQSFRIDLIGIDGNIITDTSGLNTFVVGTNLTAGETIAWYNPKTKPTPAIGLRITNLGTVTPYIHKVEIDPVPQGK